MENINGPINVVRVEGTVHGVKKVAYLFMDQHFNLRDQTECNVEENIDISEFIKKQLKFNDDDNSKNKTKNFIDVFIELGNETEKMYDDESYTYQRIYIIETIKMILLLAKQKTFNYSRYHKVDKRDILNMDIFSMTGEILDWLKNSMKNTTINDAEIDKCVNVLKKVETILTTIAFYTNLSHDKKNKINGKSTKINKNIEKFFNKILNNYHHMSTKKCMLEYFKNINNIIENSLSIVHNVYKFIDNNRDKVVHNKEKNKYIIVRNNATLRSMVPFFEDLVEFKNSLYKKITDLHVLTIKLFTWFMDIYAMRRFIDKNYITTAIIYTGAIHSCNYLYILVNDFGFKITHISKMNKKIYKNVDECTKKIKKIQFKQIEEKLLELFLDSGARIQCSNISDFPLNCK
jgi:hypothetical protein